MKQKNMKKMLAYAVTAMLLPVIGLSVHAEDAAFAGEEWYDQIETVQLNREYAHSFFIPYQDMETALENEQSVFTKELEKSDYYQTLNGEWDFYFAENPAGRLTDPDDETIDWSGKLTDKITPSGRIEARHTTPFGTGVITEKISTQELPLTEDSYDTTLLGTENETTVLSQVPEAASVPSLTTETTVLQRWEEENDRSFVIEYEITFIHTNEVIS